mmetsp:Transcript_1016/g.4297  ORF Transcript_1016/g.4297 Transcript_1016/m.4297 type:complete len:322 (+) Transcript_1016:521-1486(+)
MRCVSLRSKSSSSEHQNPTRSHSERLRLASVARVSAEAEFRRARNPSITANTSSPRRTSSLETFIFGSICFPTRRLHRESVCCAVLPSTTSPYDSVRVSIAKASPKIVRRAIVTSNAASSSKDHSARSRSLPLAGSGAVVATAPADVSASASSGFRFGFALRAGSSLAYPSLRSLAFSSGCAASTSSFDTDPSSNRSFRRRVWSSSQALRTRLPSRLTSPKPSTEPTSSAITGSGSVHSESTESLAAARARASPDVSAAAPNSASFAAYARSRNRSNPSRSATRAEKETSRARLQHFDAHKPRVFTGSPSLTPSSRRLASM